eukprot:scaffold2058_cov115-Cylindrotheca_fusiformis.AAC.13
MHMRSSFHKTSFRQLEAVPICVKTPVGRMVYLPQNLAVGGYVPIFLHHVIRVSRKTSMTDQVWWDAQQPGKKVGVWMYAQGENQSTHQLQLEGPPSTIHQIWAGTRDVTGAIFRPTNFVPTETVDDETAEAVVSLMPFVTDVVQDGKWKEVREFFSNDGTPNVPPDSPPISDASSFIVKTLLYRYHYGCYAVTRFGTNVGHGVYGSRVAI